MKIPHLRFILVFLVLVAASLACNFPANSSTPPPTPVPVSPEEVQQIEEQLQATFESSSGEVNLTITEQQINAYLTTKLAQEQEQPISNPQVDLTNEQVVLYGQVTQSGISVDTKITLQPRIDANGDPKLDVVSIDLGPFPVPNALKDRVGSMVDNALSEYIASTTDDFQVTNITVGEDEMTVAGVKQP